MTDPNRTMLALVVDRSGSMLSIETEMNGALNRLLDEQRAEPGACDLFVALFDDKYEVAYDGPIADAPPVSINPRGMTALWGAIGVTVTKVGEKLAALPEHERPGRVVVAVITDGQENHSRSSEWALRFAHRETVRGLVEHQTREYGWAFTFLGANQDALLTGADLGVSATSSLTFNPSAQGAFASTQALSHAVSTYRAGGQSVTYSPTDRAEASKS